MRFRIRRATMRDVPRMATLLGLLFGQESDFHPDMRKQKAGLKMLLRDPKAGRLWVGTSDKDIVGMVSLLYTVSTAEGGRVAWLEDLVVDPAFWGRGIGKELLSHTLKAATREGLKRVTLLTDPINRRAKKLYQADGFRRSRMVPYRWVPSSLSDDETAQ